MKHPISFTLLLCAFIPLLSCSSKCMSFDSIDDQPLPSLIDQWHARDGAAVIDVGFLLTCSFVSSPDDFLMIMSEDPAAFKSWLSYMYLHTYTQFSPKYQERDKRLRKCLLKISADYSDHPFYGHLASEIHTKASSTSLRIID